MCGKFISVPISKSIICLYCTWLNMQYITFHWWFGKIHSTKISYNCIYCGTSKLHEKGTLWTAHKRLQTDFLTLEIETLEMQCKADTCLSNITNVKLQRLRMEKLMKSLWHFNRQWDVLNQFTFHSSSFSSFITDGREVCPRCAAVVGKQLPFLQGHSNHPGFCADTADGSLRHNKIQQLAGSLLWSDHDLSLSTAPDTTPSTALLASSAPNHSSICPSDTVNHDHCLASFHG